MTRLTALGALVVLLPAAPVLASTFSTETTVCPVGGQAFEHQALASYSTFGSLPDGMPIGSAEFPLPLTECPDNGLPLYRDFQPSETAELERIVDSQEYRASRTTETSYFRAYRVALALGDDDDGLGSLLQAAWWQAKNAGDRDRAQRYGTRFADWAAERPADGDVQFFMIQLRRVNALRELGRFEEAEAARTALPAVPTADLPDGAAEQLARFIERLGPPIARRDASRSPLDLQPEWEAAARCLEEADRLDDGERAYCASDGMADALRGARRVRADRDRVGRAHPSTD